MSSSHTQYLKKIATLKDSLSKHTDKIKIKKKTASNLFRYSERDNEEFVKINLSPFNQIININEAEGILEVEGLTTYEQIVDHTLPRGFLPEVTPELKILQLEVLL